MNKSSYLRGIGLFGCAFPFLLTNTENNFFTDGKTARVVEPITNSLWMLKESGVGEYLPGIWCALFSLAIVICVFAAESGVVLSLGFTLLILGSITSFSLFFALPLAWSVALVTLGATRRTNRRLAFFSIGSLVGAIWLGPWQTLAALTLLLPIFRAKISLSEFVLLAFPSFCTTIFTKYPFANSYPQGASVSVLSGVSWVGRPFWGPDLQFSILDAFNTYQTFKYPVLILGCILAVGVFVDTSKIVTRYAGTAILLVVLDIFFRPSISDISPLAVLERIVPGFWTISIVPAVLSLGIFFTMQIIASRNYIIALALSALVLAWGAIHFERQNIGFRDQSAWVSPSASVIRTMGTIDWENLSSFKVSHLGAKQFTVVVDKVADSRILSDHNPATRIQLSNRGPSHFCVHFTSEKNIEGIVLSTGNYPADFPRGLIVTSVADCAEEKNGNVLFAQVPWRGRVMFTGDGLPYFGNQSDVRIIFHGPQTVSALRFEQTGFDATYDWSIAGLSLLRR